MATPINLTTVPGRMYGWDGTTSEPDAEAFARRLPAFKAWWTKAQTMPIQEVRLLEIYPFGPVKTAKKGFLKVMVRYTNRKGALVSSVIFIRGAAVAVLVVLEDETGEKWTLVVRQTRIAAGDPSYWEIPAGMVDEAHNFVSVAQKEMKEELDLEIGESDLQFLCKSHPSIGGCDEEITFYHIHRRMEREKILSFQARHTGVAEENEDIVVHVLTLNELKHMVCTGSFTDMKAIVALGMLAMTT